MDRELKSLLGRVGRAISDYGMISAGDRIAVGVSGGKDSLTLVYALDHFRRVAPVDFEVVGVTVATGMGDDLSPVAGFCSDLGIQFHLEETRIGPIVFQARKEDHPCSLCANMRRGALNGAACRLGCRKVALAHHLDDAVETFLMNTMFAGKVATFSPVTYLSRRDITVVRPLVYCTEDLVRRVSTVIKAPVVNQTCPASGHTCRSMMKDVVSQIRQQNPRVDDSMLASMKQLWKRSAT